MIHQIDPIEHKMRLLRQKSVALIQINGGHSCPVRDKVGLAHIANQWERLKTAVCYPLLCSRIVSRNIRSMSAGLSRSF